MQRLQRIWCDIGFLGYNAKQGIRRGIELVTAVHEFGCSYLNIVSGNPRVLHSSICFWSELLNDTKDHTLCSHSALGRLLYGVQDISSCKLCRRRCAHFGY